MVADGAIDHCLVVTIYSIKMNKSNKRLPSRVEFVCRNSELVVQSWSNGSKRIEGLEFDILDIFEAFQFCKKKI
jgi:hypothetical protein